MDRMKPATKTVLKKKVKLGLVKRDKAEGRFPSVATGEAAAADDDPSFSLLAPP